MLSNNVQVKEGFCLFELHFFAFRSCASAHGAGPGASWHASAYPDCTDQQSLGMDQASVMHCLPKQKGQLACPRPARQVSLQRQQDRPASTALPSPALSPLRSTIPEKASSPSQTRHPDPQTHSSWACPPRGYRWR